MLAPAVLYFYLFWSGLKSSQLCVNVWNGLPDCVRDKAATVEFAYIDSSSISTLFVGPGEIPIFYVHSSSPISTSALSSVRLYRHSFLSPRTYCSFIAEVTNMRPAKEFPAAREHFGETSTFKHFFPRLIFAMRYQKLSP